jgi:transketolase
MSDQTSDVSMEICRNIVRMAAYSGASHVGSCLSIADILVTLYFKVLKIDPKDPAKADRDKFILSKAHGSAALYATLAERGFFPKDYLQGYFVDEGILPGHLDKDAVPGVEVSGGSLGHGLSIGAGMAIANRNDCNKGKIYVLLGDGECNEGSVWEAVMLASTLKLNNLTAIIDYNKLQGFGRANEVINQENMKQRWSSFGWDAYEVDGHDLGALERTLAKSGNMPKVVIAHTVKGKGVSFMENRLEWHYKSPDPAEYALAMKELKETK